MLLGWVLHDKFERYEEAEAAYRKCLEYEPDVAWTWTRLAEVLKHLGRDEEAKEAELKAIDCPESHQFKEGACSERWRKARYQDGM